jgi:nitroimidazol reductase NimA-like FMN-containing flavoprotein (pyridoxamine 5'-phosphate oxidase superfamily)
MNELATTERTKLRRHPERGNYDREQIYSILDESYVCHVGFTVDGQPYVIPMAYGRAEDRIFIHGSALSRLLTSLSGGIPVCVTVTIVDGLVLARSAFRHSLNYRSVVILGKAKLVTAPAEKKEAMRVLTNHIVPGRWEETRQPNEPEIQKTSVLAIPLDEASAKIRTGPPLDLSSDLELPAWAGVIPLRTELGDPQPDAHVRPGVTVDKTTFQRNPSRKA